MKQEELKRALEENLSGYQATRKQYDAIILKIIRSDDVQPQRKRIRLSLKRVAVGMLAALVLLTATALAVGYWPGVYQWLFQRRDAERLGSVESLEARMTSLYFDHDMTITVVEAAADEGSFLCNIKVASSHELVVPFSGSMQEIDSISVENPQGLPVNYVSMQAVCGGFDQEIYTTSHDNEGALSIMSEGFGDVGAADELTVTVKRVREGEITEEHVSVPVKKLPTLQEARLRVPIALGDTGYTMETLTLRRTALRTYVDWHAEMQSQPLAYALKHPFIRLVDADGKEINRFWPYNEKTPLSLTIQVWSKDQTELLYERTLSIEDFEEVTP